MINEYRLGPGKGHQSVRVALGRLLAFTRKPRCELFGQRLNLRFGIGVDSLPKRVVLLSTGLQVFRFGDKVMRLRERRACVR